MPIEFTLNTSMNTLITLQNIYKKEKTVMHIKYINELYKKLYKKGVACLTGHNFFKLYFNFSNSCCPLWLVDPCLK